MRLVRADKIILLAKQLWITLAFAAVPLLAVGAILGGDWHFPETESPPLQAVVLAGAGALSLLLVPAFWLFARWIGSASRLTQLCHLPETHTNHS